MRIFLNVRNPEHTCWVSCFLDKWHRILLVTHTHTHWDAGNFSPVIPLWWVIVIHWLFIDPHSPTEFLYFMVHLQIVLVKVTCLQQEDPKFCSGQTTKQLNGSTWSKKIDILKKTNHRAALPSFNISHL